MENLIDNGDFLEPINQRGMGENTNVQYSYPLDRWIFDKSADLISAGWDSKRKYLYIANNAPASGNNWGSLCQRINPSKLTTGNYTLILHEVITTPIIVRVYNDNTQIASLDLSPNADGLIVFNFSISNIPTTCLSVILYITGGHTVSFDWIDLYKGTFTAENRPPHVPKGYAAELAECQRYYQKGTARFTLSTSNYVILTCVTSLPIKMRVIPTITYSNAVDFSTGATVNIVEKYSMHDNCLPGIRLSSIPNLEECVQANFEANADL